MIFVLYFLVGLGLSVYPIWFLGREKWKENNSNPLGTNYPMKPEAVITGTFMGVGLTYILSLTWPVWLIGGGIWWAVSRRYEAKIRDITYRS